METQKRECKEKLGAEEVLSELELILKEFFVAKIERENGKIGMTFLDGQKFYLSVQKG